MEMHTIKSLTSGMTKCDMKALRLEQARAQVIEYGEVEHKLGKISPVYNVKLFCNCFDAFCNCFVASVRIATTFWEDVDDSYEKCRVSRVALKDQHASGHCKRSKIL